MHEINLSMNPPTRRRLLAPIKERVVLGNMVVSGCSLVWCGFFFGVGGDAD